MKKVALSLAVIATLALVSCGNKAKQADTDTVAQDTEVVVAEDTNAQDTDTNKVAEEAPAQDTNKAEATK